MTAAMKPAIAPPARTWLPFPYRSEAEVVAASMAVLEGQLDWPAVIEAARPWVLGVRATPAPF